LVNDFSNDDVFAMNSRTSYSSGRRWHAADCSIVKVSFRKGQKRERERKREKKKEVCFRADVHETTSSSNSRFVLAVLWQVPPTSSFILDSAVRTSKKR
jgi:hypothetical protein